ncbi:MAG: alpha/beta hydrolase [Rubellimicrobium sp.]|nr:alpha/beta hydrolase [Rubellimicrobium sp.]
MRLALHDDGGPGLPFVLQHGLCGDARQTAEAFPPDHAVRRLTLECPGHGASPLAGRISIAAFADHVAALIETLPHPVILGGISMGAAIALRLATLRPDLVRALILIRPAWVTEDAPPNMAPNALVGRLLATLPRDEALARFTQSPVAARLAREAPDNFASLLGFFDRAPLAETATLLQTISADGPGITPAQVARITVPTLICGTGRDDIHPLDHSGRLAALIPSRLVELPPKTDDKSRHLAALHAALTAFVKEL